LSVNLCAFFQKPSKGIKGSIFESTIDEEFSKMLDYITEIKADSLLNDFGDD
jgi:hypothetical protein